MGSNSLGFGPHGVGSPQASSFHNWCAADRIRTNSGSNPDARRTTAGSQRSPAQCPHVQVLSANSREAESLSNPLSARVFVVFAEIPIQPLLESLPGAYWDETPHVRIWITTRLGMIALPACGEEVPEIIRTASRSRYLVVDVPRAPPLIAPIFER